MRDFVYQALPARVIFRTGALSLLAEEVQRRQPRAGADHARAA